jgi:cytochrome b subunit of formate dehydrogenase
MRSGIRLALASVVLIATVILLFIGTARAQDIDCAECHEDVVFSSPVHPDVACHECHTNVTAEHEAADDLEPLTDEESCVECHGRIQRTVNRSAHEGEADCNDCHGAPHEIGEVADLHSPVSTVGQLQSCGGCHDTEEMPLELFVASEHGRALLLSGLDAAPGCSDCHGGHRIYAVDNDSSPTSHENSPEMCGTCHTHLIDDWRHLSAHGIAWEAGEEGPVCTDCHATHDIVDPTTAVSRLESADNCGGCHEEYLGTFRDSFHGQASDLGMAAGAVCADCHTPHKNLPADDPRSSVHPDNVAATCGQCHDNVTANFASFQPHNDPTNPEDHFGVYVVWIFMTGLLIGVFAFFGFHDLLWLQRSWVGVMRGEFDEEKATSGQYVRRFNMMNVRTHAVIITTFLILALTGLPLKFHGAMWAQTLMNLLGGIDMARALHRIAAIGTFGYMAFHIFNVAYRWIVKREGGLFWGPNSMMPQPKDFSDFFANIRYFLYMGERPAGDRWTYFEKFDYLAVFWGVMIIGVSGLMLWFPGLFTTYLPGWVLNAAHVIHSDEALLATGFIFVFHFFHTHLRPESFPMDTVIFTGKMPLERFRSERPLEYQRLVDNGELDNYLVPPPRPRQLRRAYIWGTIALSTGIVLAIGIIWALLSH